MNNTSCKAPWKYGWLLLILFILAVALATIFYTADRDFTTYTNSLRTPFGDFVWLNITHTAGVVSYGLAVLSAIYLAFAWKRGKRMQAMAIVLSGIFSGIAVTVIKIVVQRNRPFKTLGTVQALGPKGGWSFPSGHTADAFFLAAILFILYPQKKLLLATVYIWAFLVAISRVYLGVHYYSDVLAGMAISSAMAILGYQAAFLMEKRLTV
jgi:undecaprenyl-diphosphatase